VNFAPEARPRFNLCELQGDMRAGRSHQLLGFIFGQSVDVL
jgi:hypothetical protein